MSGPATANAAARTANDRQVGGDHYKKKAIQPWDFITENNIPYLEGNIVRYLARWRDKGGIDDLRKAQHYLQKVVENEERRLQEEILKELTAEPIRVEPVPFGTLPITIAAGVAAELHKVHTDAEMKKMAARTGKFVRFRRWISGGE